LSLFVSAGLSVNVHVNDYNTESLTDSTGHTSTTSDKTNYGFNRINLQAIASFGTSYAICNHLSVVLAPEAAYSITSIIQAPIKEYLYSFGINAGVYWKF
ncbi:MAG TPA: hypothetical protein VN922_11480, partial [Bacteroidia bacterium]|nr:hypothetical protein [Bacteroidia bacterium]